jgi:hypothetical protein
MVKKLKNGLVFFRVIISDLSSASSCDSTTKHNFMPLRYSRYSVTYYCLHLLHLLLSLLTLITNMIQSLFMLSPVGEVLIERHFRGVVTSRSVCDSFWEQASRSVEHHGGVSASLLRNAPLYDTVPPVMEVPESDQGTLYVISILRDGLSYLAVCPAEVSPLLILEFLHRIASIFVQYFGCPVDESAIKENFSTVYQLLEEMVDYGWPLTTEPYVVFCWLVCLVTILMA